MAISKNRYVKSDGSEAVSYHVRISGQSIGCYRTINEAKKAEDIAKELPEDANNKRVTIGVTTVTTTRNNKTYTYYVAKYKMKYLGCYRTHQQARKAYQDARNGTLPQPRTRTSQYKGVHQVHYYRRRKKTGEIVEYTYWRSMVVIDGKQKSLGSFKTEEEAYQAYINYLSQS